MTQCPVCGAAAKATAPECECGESLTVWRTVARSSAVVRDRGLTLAAGGDYVGATVALLTAALTNPLDAASLVDAGRALARLGRYDDAARLLESAKGGPRATEAAAVLAAVAELAAAEPLEVGDEPTQPAAAAAPPAPLGLPPLPKAGGFLTGKRADAAVVAQWDRVIRMEAEPARDWRRRGSAVEELVRSDPSAVYHYALGLGAWQEGNRAAAADAFRRCVTADPPVLNPVAHLLFLHLDDAAAARKLWAELKRVYPAKDLDRCRAALRDRLAARGDTAGAHAVDALAAN